MIDFDSEQDLIKNRLRRYSQQQYEAPQGQMIGPHYVAPHAFQQIAAALRGYGGIKGTAMAENELKDLSTRRNTAMADVLRGYTEKMTGSPEKRTEVPSQMFVADDAGGGEMAMGTNTQVTPAVAPDPRAAYASLLSSQFPQLQQFGMTGMAKIPEMEAAQAERQENRDFRREEAQAARDARMEQIRMQQEMRQQQLQDQNENRRQMIQLQASLRPERNVTVMGPNGEAITMPQSQAQGMQTYNPQAAAQLQKSKTKNEAREQLSGVVQQLNNSYNALEKGGGITSTNQGALGNIGARIGSSGVGQVFGGALGTENQRQRQEIEQTRPLLLNLIKEATGMSAQQMNSNAEMQLYLQAATDPTLTVEANRSALANLDKMFGLGLAKRPEEAGANNQNARSPQDQQALQWAQQNPNDPRSSEIIKRLGGR